MSIYSDIVSEVAWGPEVQPMIHRITNLNPEVGSPLGCCPPWTLGSEMQLFAHIVSLVVIVVAVVVEIVGHLPVGQNNQ